MLTSHFISRAGWTSVVRGILPCLSLVALLGQDPTARVTGTVTDESGLSELAAATAGGQQSYYARHLDKGLSGNDIRHRLTGSFVYELPIGKNKLLALNNS